MQIDDVGTVCMMRGCSEVDVLPVRCSLCRKQFCHAHQRPDAHRCAADVAVPNVPAPGAAATTATTAHCPLCSAVVPVAQGQSPDVVISRHMDAGCRPTAPLSSAQVSGVAGSGAVVQERMNYCSYGQCTVNEIQRVVCSDCGQTYCFTHKDPQRHDCSRRLVKPRTPPPAAPAPTRVSPQARRTTPPPQRTGLDAPFANTPKTAVGAKPGAGPAGDDVVLRCYFHFDSGAAPRYVFFSPGTVAGRALDVACKVGDLPNRNHAVRSDAERLFLFHLNSGRRLATAETIGAACAAGDALFVGLGPELPAPVVAAVEKAQAHAGGGRDAAMPGAKGKDSKDSCAVQ